ncbi:MAG: LysR family transcriptional regulator [Gammaproteobacteria bacterium]|nr:LysR family transcriptional regulator [Gammaproteobacteria bacterium]
MPPRRVDLNLYRIFDTIYQEGSLTRAAEVLHLTQPAVSNALARLREVYADALFVRTATGMVPTPLAETVAADVRAALQLLHGSLGSAKAFDPATTPRRFRLAAGDLAAATVVPRVLGEIARLGLNIGLEVSALRREALVHELTSGQIDFALDAVAIGDPQILSMKVLSDEYVCAVRPDHPAVGRRISLKQYLALDHAHASSRRQGLGQVDLALKRLGQQRRIAVRTPYHLGLPHLVAVSDLAATIPRSLAAAHDLRILKLPFEMPPSELFAFRHKSAHADGASLWFRELLGKGAHEIDIHPNKPSPSRRRGPSR